MKKVGARAGLKRPNRSRGYSTYIARHKENSRNYIVLLGLERKNFIFSMAAVQKLDSSQNCSDLDHGSGGKWGKRKRGQGESVLVLTHSETHHGARNRSWKAMRIC